MLKKRDPIFGKSLHKEPSRMVLYFKKLATTFHPKRYHDLVLSEFMPALKFFSYTLLLAMFILSMVSGYLLLGAPEKLDQEFSKITDLKFDGNITETLTFERVGITISDHTKYDGENLLYSHDFFYRKPFACFVIKSYCLFNSSPVKMSYNFNNNQDDFVTLSFYLLLLMLPGVLLVSFIFLFFKYLVISQVTALVVFVITRALKSDILAKHIFISAIYATPVLLFIDLLSIPFANLYFVPYLIYLVFFSLAVYFQRKIK